MSLLQEHGMLRRAASSWSGRGCVWFGNDLLCHSRFSFLRRDDLLCVWRGNPTKADVILQTDHGKEPELDKVWGTIKLAGHQATNKYAPLEPFGAT